MPADDPMLQVEGLLCWKIAAVGLVAMGAARENGQLGSELPQQDLTPALLGDRLKYRRLRVCPDREFGE